MPDPRQTLLKTAAAAFMVAVVCLWVLFVTGCASSGSSPVVPWNPLTWWSRAAPSSVDRAERKADQAAAEVANAQAAAVHAAHVEVAKADVALAAAPDSRPVQVARRTTGNALGLLSQVRPLTVEESAEVRQLVADLLSERAEVAAAAEKRQRAVESELAQVGRDLEEARASLRARETALASANANLRDAYDRENRLANQVRNFWFVAGLLAVLWLGGTVLGAVARVYPPLAPLSRAVNGLAAPALAFAEARASDGLRRVGHAMARLRTAVPEAADRVVEIFDQETDRDHQRAIGTAANTAPRGP